MLKSKSSHSSKHLGLLVSLAAVLLIAASGFLLWIRHSRLAGQHPNDTSAKTTSTAPSAQSNYKGGSKTTPTPTATPNASGTDQNGSTTTQTPPESNWTTSTDGTSIVVYGPNKNGLLTSGDSVFGTATSSTVSYRLSDNVSGLLTTGTANVVNGKFSIKLTFSTSATSGNVEVFDQANSYSPESNNVIIPVRFK